MQEVKGPIRWRHYIGWVFLALTLIPLITLSLYLHMKENQELAAEQDANKWKSNWPQLKVGMSKEEVLGLVGAPSSTIIQNAQAASVTTNPPNEKIEQDVQQALNQEANYTIWSYYGPIVIRTTPGEDPSNAEQDGEAQLKQLANFSADGKLHGHAIEFNEAGKIVEISSQ